MQENYNKRMWEWRGGVHNDNPFEPDELTKATIRLKKAQMAERDSGKKSLNRYRVRIQVQGDIIEKIVKNEGGISEDFGGDRPVSVTVAEGIYGLNKLREKTIKAITYKKYLKYYDRAFKEAERFIYNARPGGVVPTGGDIPFPKDRKKGKIARVDINIIEGVNIDQ